MAVQRLLVELQELPLVYAVGILHDPALGGLDDPQALGRQHANDRVDHRGLAHTRPAQTGEGQVLHMDPAEDVFDATAFTHNRERLENHGLVGAFFDGVVKRALDLGHWMTGNRNGLVAAIAMTEANGTAAYNQVRLRKCLAT